MTVRDWLGFFLAVLVLATFITPLLVDFNVFRRTDWMFSLSASFAAVATGLAVAIVMDRFIDFVRFLLK